MDKTEELLTRGVSKIYPSKEELEKLLRSGKKLKVYQGFDPTSPQLHIGHMVGLRKLRQWQELGHQVIFLIGDFTGMIGDPSGKDSARTPLTKTQIEQNAKTYKEQASKILNFTGDNPVRLMFNSEWLGKMSAADFMSLAKNITYGQVVERDMFQKRLKKGHDVYINEFLYPIMQAFDSVEMNIDAEVGGEDQTFNMLMGRKLMRNMKKKEKFVMTTPLLTDAKGQKIGKTEGNAIALDDRPSDLFAKIMALGDDIIVKGFEYLTDIEMDQVKQIASNLKSGKNPITYKKKLAFEIVKQLHNHDEAHKAQEGFDKKISVPLSTIIFKPTFVSSATVAQGTVSAELTTSMSEADRVIKQGGLRINSQVIKNPNEPLSKYITGDEALIQRGPRKAVKIKVK